MKRAARLHTGESAGPIEIEQPLNACARTVILYFNERYFILPRKRCATVMSNQETPPHFTNRSLSAKNVVEQLLGKTFQIIMLVTAKVNHIRGKRGRLDMFVSMLHSYTSYDSWYLT